MVQPYIPDAAVRIAKIKRQTRVHALEGGAFTNMN